MRLRYPDKTVLFTQDKRYTLDASLSREDVKIRYTLTEDACMRITVTADETPIRFLRLRWNYNEEERMDGIVRAHGSIFSVPYGAVNRRWDSIMPEAYMPWYFMMTNGTDSKKDAPGTTRACGVMTGGKSFCFWQNDMDGFTLWVDLRCGTAGVLLRGRELDAATVVFREYNEHCFTETEKQLAGNVFLACEDFCRVMCPHPILPKEPVYGSNNWYYAYGNSSHEEIIQDASFLAKMTAGLDNRPFMVIDDGWQQYGCTGPWDKGSKKFPDMPGLAQVITNMGVKPGIWYRPLSDAEKTLTWATDEMRHPLDASCLDPSHPTVLAHIKEDMKRFADWGYRLVKHDYSTHDMFGFWKLELNPAPVKEPVWSFYNTGKTGAEIVLDFYRALREAAGEDVIILGCNTIHHLAAGLVEVNRTGDDTSGILWEKTRVAGVNTLAFCMCQNRTFYASDADCIGITEKIPWELNRQWLYALAHSGSPLFVSCKLGILGDEQLSELRRAFAAASVQSDRMVPLNWTETNCPDRWLLNGTPISFHWIPDEGCDSIHME